ncbi:DUF6397 family protein [Streptomyces sp. XD-27]|uniref:DUF6397 family protein n=1 Tax=Streptomyces sp. XD-27 TaxID=3062779 RepID=UPI0026F47BED|nr:DUF6397 family protein [Streptomyces sp. XD-27]WKX74097.1 DUF6397 family protein [Streptomyces sp. XD-27]
MGAGEGEPPTGTVSLSRAARELRLKPREFALAVQLGEVRTVTGGLGERPRVPRAELARLTATEELPRALAARLRVVGTAEGAELLGVGPARFARLAKGGGFHPVSFYINRYRAVVWLYLAVELEEFADREPGLLRGRTPERLRAAEASGEDLRARTWRARRVGQLLSRADGPWERAAVTAAVLAPEDLESAVPDPRERTCLVRLAPPLVVPRAGSPAYHDAVDGLLTAEDPDEIRDYRRDLDTALSQARRHGPVPPLPPQSPGREAMAEPPGPDRADSAGRADDESAGRTTAGPAAREPFRLPDRARSRCSPRAATPTRPGHARPLWRRLLGRS